MERSRDEFDVAEVAFVTFDDVGYCECYIYDDDLLLYDFFHRRLYWGRSLNELKKSGHSREISYLA